jgi:zinc transporter ZupT
MESHFWTSFIASLLAAAVTTTGLIVIRRFEGWARANTAYFSCFAAGVLISVSFLHIIPEALRMSAMAPVFLLSGYVVMHIMNRFLTAFVCDKPETENYVVGLVPLFGIGLHSFIDGVIYSVTFKISLFTGMLSAFGMVLHEFPEGVVTYLLLLKGGFSKRKAMVLAFAAAAVTTPLGALMAFPLISRTGPEMLGSTLAVSAGALIYVGATHLLPQAEREPKRYSLVALGAGLLCAGVVVASKG